MQVNRELGWVTPSSSAELRLTTPRLTLRPVVPGDAEPTARLVTPDVAANLSTWASPMTAAEASERIARARTLFEAGAGVDLAIVSRDRETLLGWIGFARDGDSARLGYWLGTEFRGRGLMKEAVIAACPAAAAFLDVERVHALVLKGNAPSIALLAAAGFELIGEELVHLEVANESRACLRFEWRAAEERNARA